MSGILPHEHATQHLSFVSVARLRGLAAQGGHGRRDLPELPQGWLCIGSVPSGRLDLDAMSGGRWLADLGQKRHWDEGQSLSGSAGR